MGVGLRLYYDSTTGLDEGRRVLREIEFLDSCWITIGLRFKDGFRWRKMSTTWNRIHCNYSSLSIALVGWSGLEQCGAWLSAPVMSSCEKSNGLSNRMCSAKAQTKTPQSYPFSCWLNHKKLASSSFCVKPVPAWVPCLFVVLSTESTINNPIDQSPHWCL